MSLFIENIPCRESKRNYLQALLHVRTPRIFWSMEMKNKIPREEIPKPIIMLLLHSINSPFVGHGSHPVEEVLADAAIKSTEHTRQALGI